MIDQWQIGYDAGRESTVDLMLRKDKLIVTLEEKIERIEKQYENELRDKDALIVELRGRGKETDRNFPEEFNLENGMYANTCTVCNNQFVGSKHRVVCKLCSK
jgi:hypothetical protein